MTTQIQQQTTPEMMKNIFLVLMGVLIPMLTANCSERKTVEKAETSEATAKTGNAINVSASPFKKFVVVTSEEDEPLYKRADTDSPTLMLYEKEGCEGEDCEMIYQWSGEPVKPGYELSSDVLAYVGRILPVLDEEGDFYKVDVIYHAINIKSAYIHKSCVSDIDREPLSADILEKPSIGTRNRVIKEGKYRNIVFIDNEDELWGETLEVGVLLDGYIATPGSYSFECSQNLEQEEPIKISDEWDVFSLTYGKSLSVILNGEEFFQLDPFKLTNEQIKTLVETVKKKNYEMVKYTYLFPNRRLEYFYWTE